MVDAAYKEMRRRILDNVWPPGHRRSSRRWRSQLGMSRTPVREALVRLQNEGLVEVIPRHGMRVLPVSPTDMREIYEILTRARVHGRRDAGARKPRCRIAGSRCCRPRRAMDTALQNDDLDAWAAADERFHERLVIELAGNRQLAATVMDLLGPCPPRPHVQPALRPKPVNSDPRAPWPGGASARWRRRRRRCRQPRPPRTRQPRTAGHLRALQAGADVMQSSYSQKNETQLPHSRIARRRHRHRSHEAARATCCVAIESGALGVRFDMEYHARWREALPRQRRGTCQTATLDACRDKADAILFGAMGLPHVRGADGTEIIPQLDLRFALRPVRRRAPGSHLQRLAGAVEQSRAQEIDLVLVRESTEGLFYARGRGDVRSVDGIEARCTTP
jgi:DNA-binding FadR family transcriptional regulator